MDITTVTLEALIESPATPFWAKDLIRILEKKDPVDAANWLELVSAAYGKRVNEIFAGLNSEFNRIVAEGR